MPMTFLRAAARPLAACIGLLFSLAALSAAADNAYRLTDAGLGQYERATEAMYEYLAAHPELRGAMEDEDDVDDEDEDFDAVIRRIDQKAPGLRKAMEKSGMRLEDYFTFSTVMAANMIGLAIAEQFGGADESTLGETERANLAFMKKNRQRFETFHARLQERYGHLMEDDEDEYGEDDYGDEEYDEGY